MLVEDEAGVLKLAGVFGPPGMEAELAQQFPPEESLIFPFDVGEAQKEFKAFVQVLKSKEVMVTNLREAYAKTLEPAKISAAELLDSVGRRFPKVNKKSLKSLLQTDIELVGEEKAVTLNQELSLKYGIPLGNIYFARDQANVVYDTCVLGNMKFDVRKPEVGIIKKALASEQAITNKPVRFHQVENGTFEGGDMMLFDGSLYIGRGMRTSLSGIQDIACYSPLGFPDQRTGGFKPIQVVEIPVTGSWQGDMDIMHLDTFFMPLDSKRVLGCKEVLGKCKLHTVYGRNWGSTESNFLEFLERHYEVLDVPKAEQESYAANVLVVSPGSVIVPSDYNTGTNEVLKRSGVYTTSLDMRHLTMGLGATHCMALQLVKAKGGGK